MSESDNGLYKNIKIRDRLVTINQMVSWACRKVYDKI